MKKIKIIGILLFCVVLVACESSSPNSQPAASNSMPIVSSVESDIILNSGTTSEMVESEEPNQYTIIGENDIFIFQGENAEYLKNGEVVPIEGALPIYQDDMLYFPLKFVFDFFELDGYEETIETGNFENEYGSMELATEYFEQPFLLEEGAIYQTRATILSAPYVPMQKVVDMWGRLGKSMVFNNELYIQADLLGYIPTYFVKDEFHKYQAKYFPNAQMLVLYQGITPVKNINPAIMVHETGKSWQTIYEEIAEGTDSLGIPYSPEIKVMYYPVEYPYPQRYALYDFNQNGVPELLVVLDRDKNDYTEIFTVEQGISKYLGQVNRGAENEDDRFLVEKKTGYIISENYRRPYTYVFEDGRFEVLENYVQYETIEDEIGIPHTFQKTFTEDELQEIVFYETVEEAIAGYEASQK